MPATITSVIPNTGAPGTQVTILGTGFDSTSIAWFATDATQAADPNTTLVSSTQITAVVPDQFGGVATPVMLTVIADTTGAAASNAVPFSVLPTATEDGVIPLCTLTDVKAALGIDESTPARDAQLKFFIDVASAQIAGYCRTTFAPTVLTNELYDGDDSDMLTLRSQPILSIQAMTIDGMAVDVTTVQNYGKLGYIRFFEDSYYYNPRLGASDRIFPEGTQNVSISYTAGYNSVPADLARVMPFQVSLLMNIFNKQGISTETNNTVNATTAYENLPIAPIVQQTANRYRTKGIAVV